MAVSSINRAMVIGGTAGIGLGIARRVAADAPSSTVIIGGRTEPENLPKNIKFRKLDASSMKSIKSFTEAYKSSLAHDNGSEPAKLDLLVLTQGIFTMAGRTETPEGIDNKMALHFYGRQLLIRELRPVLHDAAKVLIVLDSTMGDPTKLNWDDLDLSHPGSYGIAAAAAHCITMTDAMVQEHAALSSVVAGQQHFVHAMPGVVNTSVTRNLPWYLKAPASGLFKVAGTTPDTCAKNLLRGTYEVAAADEKEGQFYSYIGAKGKPVPGKPVWAEDQRKKVADHTWKIIDNALNR